MAGKSIRSKEKKAGIDEDIASSLISVKLGVDCLIILPAVNAAYINYKSNKGKVGEIGVEELKKLKMRGYFAVGSILPKIDAETILSRKQAGRQSLQTQKIYQML
ncbi:MAG: hypothetical protein QXV17_13215 [Candidatus Micrarchaeaceae archaeon]